MRPMPINRCLSWTGFEISIQTLADMDPDRVASIVVLKDAVATAIYGSRAANGVMLSKARLPNRDGFG